MMPMPDYGTADVEVLLRVCRRELGTGNPLYVPSLDENGWRGLVAAAREHGLISVLQRTISRTPSVPSHIRTSIQTAYLAQVAGNFQLTTALRELLRTFADHNLEVVVLKGPAVALLLYGQIAFREFTDLDLLVRPEDLNRARFVLHTLGYLEVSGYTPKSRDQKDIQFIRAADETLVELHWALNSQNSRFPLEASGIWDRLETVYFQNEPIRTLSLEDTFIALSIHAAKHSWHKLRWVFDIAQILAYKSGTLNWDVLLERCRAVGCGRTLFFGAQLAKCLFGVKVPEQLTLQSNPLLMKLIEAVRYSLLHTTPLCRSDLITTHIVIRDRLWDRCFTAVTQRVPDLPRLMPAPLRPVTRGPLRFITRTARLLRLCGFSWLRIAIVGR
jgi:hypothetical protein